MEVEPRGLAPDPVPLTLSVVGCAYNEEANIGRFLQGCLDNQGSSFRLVQVVVVASGCTDRTESITREFSARDSRVLLLAEPTRQGKAAALAAGLRSARGEVVLIEGVDTVPDRHAFEKVVGPFRDPEVTLVCGHPVPFGPAGGFMMELNRTMWEIHHFLSSIDPKTGEAYAVRNREFVIPSDIQDDDTYMGAVAGGPGSRKVYAAGAIFYNRVPTSPSDFLRQRWRVNHQEIVLRRRTGISVSSWSPRRLTAAVWRFLEENPRRVWHVGALAGAETVTRATAIVTSSTAPTSLTRWHPIRSTKEPVAVPEASGLPPTRDRP